MDVESGHFLWNLSTFLKMCQMAAICGEWPLFVESVHFLWNLSTFLKMWQIAAICGEWPLFVDTGPILWHIATFFCVSGNWPLSTFKTKSGRRPQNVASCHFHKKKWQSATKLGQCPQKVATCHKLQPFATFSKKWPDVTKCGHLPQIWTCT